MIYVPTYCVACGRKFEAQDYLEPRMSLVDDPWPAEMRLYITNCRSCGLPTHASNVSSLSTNTSIWFGSSEQMVPGEDYEYLHRRAGERLDGRVPIMAVWAFHPMPRCTEYHGLVEESLGSLRIHNDMASVLILPAMFDPDTYANVWHRFDQVWHLHDAVTADGIFPYPSMRAERSICRSLETTNRLVVPHYWPAATLSSEAYQSLLSAEEMHELWSEYCRSNIEIEPVTME